MFLAVNRKPNYLVRRLSRGPRDWRSSAKVDTPRPVSRTAQLPKVTA
jgi:hypothetical protein